MIYLCRLNPFIKFNIYNIVLKPWRIIFQHFSTAYIYTLIGGFSEMKSLSANFSWLRFSKLLRRIFLLIRVFCFCFLYLNFAIIVSFFQTMASFKVISNSFKTFFYFLILNFAIIVSFFSDDGKYLLQRERKRERGRESFENIIFQLLIANWCRDRAYFYRFASMILSIVDCILLGWFVHSEEDCNFFKQILERIKPQIF